MINPPPPKPLQFGPLLQRAFTIFGGSFAALALMALVVSVPTQALAVAGGLLARGTQQHMVDVGNVLSLLASLLVAPLISIAGIEVVRARRDDRAVSLTTLLAVTGRWFLPVIGLTIVVGAAVFVGLILLIVPGVYLAVRWAVAVPAMVVEETGVGDALGASWKQTEGRWWLTLGLLLVGYLIPTLGAGVIGGLISSVGTSAADGHAWILLVSNGVGTVITSVLAAPFVAVYVALLYLDMVAAGPAGRVPEPAWPAAPGAAEWPAPTVDAAPPPPPPPVAPPSEPLPGGYLPPRPGTGSGGDFPPPPQTPPAASD